ncbi:MAG: DUF6894 family protein [Xanthobacteraceae bacterium]
MPRFYFDLVDDQTVYDHKGVSLPDQQEAQNFATTFARELIEAKSELLGESWTAWSIRVSDGRFQPVLTIPLGEIARKAKEVP